MSNRQSESAGRDVIVGFDFSTGAVKGIAFDTAGHTVAEIRLSTDLWTANNVNELNLFQLEGQARAAMRAMSAQLRDAGRLADWKAIGISGTHHTAGRIDKNHNQIRRAICWNDQTLDEFHDKGLSRLGGMQRVRELIGGPWASRYTLSHLVKDEALLPIDDWRRTKWIVPHGPLAAGFLTDRFDVVSVSAAASTGIMDVRTNRWRPEMLDCIENQEMRTLADQQLPAIIDSVTPIAPISESVAVETGISLDRRPLVFPTSDDQQAGLIGGGAVEAGDVAIILGNSAVVNSSASQLPRTGSLDAMRLNWGPYLWMRCYNNGAQFLDRIVGERPDWNALETAARAVAPGCNGIWLLPFALPEPSMGIKSPRLTWQPSEPSDPGARFRAALESLAYLMALGVREHEQAGQPVRRIVMSGGIAKSELMGEILASVLNRSIDRLQSSEGPALGAAITAFWGLQSYLRREIVPIADSVASMTRYRAPASPNSAWIEQYRRGLQQFAEAVKLA